MDSIEIKITQYKPNSICISGECELSDQSHYTQIQFIFKMLITVFNFTAENLFIPKSLGTILTLFIIFYQHYVFNGVMFQHIETKGRCVRH